MPTLRASALVMTAVMRNNVRPDPQLSSRILRKVWPLALIVAVLMIAASTSIYLVSSFRGVLIGESLWSKAQKDAVYYLNSYVDSANPADLEKFRAALKIPAGDRAVLQALEKIPPDLDGAQAAALQGGIHADDVKSVVWLLHKFRHTSLMEEPMRYWRDGDRYLEQLKGLAREIREKHTHAQTTERDIATWKREITQINEGVTPATVAFSQAHGQQGLEPLTVGDAGQRVFFGKTLQRVLQQAAFTHMAQAAAQHIAGQAGAHQPVADARRGARRFAVEQQNRGQAAAAR